MSSLGGGGYRISFTAPGGNGPCGVPASYLTRLNGKKYELNLQPVAGGSTFSAAFTLPSGTTRLSIQAVDAAGNIGPEVAAPVD